VSAPKNTDIHERLRALLDENGAIYRLIEHQAEGRTEVIARIRGNRTEQAIKSIVVQVRFGKENRYYLANVPGDCRVDLQAIRAHLQATGVAIAPRERAEELAGCVVGAVPPFSFNERLTVLADPRIGENEQVVFNAGRLDRSIFMKSSDYMRVARPQLLQMGLRVQAHSPE
jgi:Ala-tRNA(Pro) deacylase